VVYTDGLVDKALVQELIIKTLMIDFKLINVHSIDSKNTFQILRDFVITAGEIKEITNFKTLYKYMLSGYTIILIHDYKKGFAVSLKGGESREVREPSSQTVVRGPKDGFTEMLRTNTALIRRKVKSPNLWIETKSIGRETMTDVAIMYIKDIANEKIVEEVRRRLDKIDIDGILESGYIEEFIQDEVYTPFPTVINTERPDSVAAGLLEGRIAILVDGTPFVLLVPALFIDFFQSSEDYYMRFDISTLIRLIRYISFFLHYLYLLVYSCSNFSSRNVTLVFL
jgi:spore germination protein KA